MSFAFNKYACLISIDIGNTYSGSCFAITGGLSDIQLRDKNTYDVIENANLRPADVNVVRYSINQHQIMTKNKVPTVIIYDVFNNFSYWGYSAVQNIKEGRLNQYDTIIEKFKHNLPKSINQKSSFQRSKVTEKSTEDDNLRAIIDYLKSLYDYIQEFIKKHRYGSDYEISSIRFVITVPTMWGSVERAIMRQIVIQAGLISEKDHENRLLIISESLAATLYAEREISDKALVVGDKYIVCDAGGSTVGIATFIKTNTQSEDISFSRCQLTADFDDGCGSTFLDLNMEKLLSKILYGEDIFTDGNQQKDMSKKTQDKRKNIEYILKKFIGIEEDSYLKKKFCNNMKIEITDEEYFKQHKENFGELLEQSTKFTNFPDVKLIEDADFEFTNSSEFKYSHDDEDEDEGKDNDENVKYYINKDGIYSSNEYELIIPFEVMVKHVFGPIIKTILELLERQLKKVNNYVKYIFLVGGFSRCHYLKRRIEQVFKDRADIVYAHPNGDEASMRGAAYYGVDGVKRPAQTDFNDANYKENFNSEYYNTVICIDVGYDHTSCSYVNLNHQNPNEQTTKEVKDWPGLNDRNAVKIPTAYDNDNNTWGATVSNISDVNPNKFIVPNRFMSIVKDDLRRFLAGFLRHVHRHALQYIARAEGKTDTSRFRYCITMENSYKYFNKKQDMRRIAVEAGIVPIDHDPKRLLLIKREDASAMHFEDRHFKVKEPSTYFLQIFFRHDSCHLSLQEATKISGFNNSPRNDYFRNVRGIRSSTLQFNLVAKLAANLEKYISKYPCIRCPNDHIDYFELREELLTFIKEILDFNSNDNDLKIPIGRFGCCVISISMLDLLEHIFRPAFRDLITKISHHYIQTEMNSFKLDKVFLADRLFQTKENTYKFLEKIFIKMLAESLDLESFIIQPPEIINQASIKGAVIYGRHPETYTERVARKTYFVTVEAFAVKEFDKNVQDQINKELSLDRQYDIEAKKAYRDPEQRIQLFYEPAQNPSCSYPMAPYYKNILIKRSTKIAEDDETNGIKKSFYTEKECIVYASIYTTEHNNIIYPDVDTGINESSIPDPKIFQKIHQFEIYIKEDPNDALNMIGNPRHYFEIRMILDNNEAMFEASLTSRIDEMIPEFRFRDELLVANIYDDSQEIELKETSRI